jgi:2-polyprenyl-3-methyl-5-hydroxy-6-metoxy-1,4-benzoquinol methylase
MEKTREPQYQSMVELEGSKGLESLGMMTSYAWNDDPKHLTFTLSRYKFVSRLLASRKNVLEIGCADAFGTRIVRQEVGKLTAVDFDPIFIKDVKERMNPKWSFETFVHDMLTGPVPGSYDGIYALDVLEHIEPKVEKTFLDNLVGSLAPHGVVVLGMPSLESQIYASPHSKAGHVNCKTMPDFKSTMAAYFHNVFMFGMNDEMVHTGFHKMAHYLVALCVERKA